LVSCHSFTLELTFAINSVDKIYGLNKNNCDEIVALSKDIVFMEVAKEWLFFIWNAFREIFVLISNCYKNNK